MENCIMHLVFVYGTLKDGQPNHHWLTRQENGIMRLKGIGTTVEKYPLVIATRYNIPFLLKAPGVGNNVMGEVYEVDEKMLKNLDILEEHPNYYVRQPEPILLKSDNRTIDCWTYFLKTYKPELLNKEMFISYDAAGSHNLQYCARYDRDPNYDYRGDVLG